MSKVLLDLIRPFPLVSSTPGPVRAGRVDGGLFREVDALYHDLAGTRAPLGVAVRLRETDEAWLVELRVPGVKAEDLQVEATADAVTVKGVRHDQAPEGLTALHRERSQGTFARTFTFPTRVQPEAVRADLREGLLTVALPKAQAPGARRVPVTTA